MELLQPADWREALEARAAHPGALPLWGGTDVMVDLNFGRERPEAILDLTRVRELAEWQERDGLLRVGAGVTYTRAIAELGEALPGLAAASRTVGSPQIRNRGTIGGNLGSSSPAGDALPPLYASGAEVELASARGTRRVPIGEFITGPEAQRARARRADRRVPRRARGRPAAVLQGRHPQRDGDRRLLVRARAPPARAPRRHVHRLRRPDPAGAPPTPRRSRRACSTGTAARRPRTGDLARFGELVAAAASPIDDVRGSAAYRRHALGVLARRSLAWAWSER